MANKGEVSVDLRLALAGFRRDLRAAVAEMRKGLDFRVDMRSAVSEASKVAAGFKAVAREAKAAAAEASKVKSPKVTFTEGGRSSYRIANPWQSSVDTGGYMSATAALRQTQMNTERRMRLEELLAARAEGLRGFNAQDYYGNRGQFAPKYNGPVPPQMAYSGQAPPVLRNQPGGLSAIIGRMTAGGQNGPLSSPLAVAAQLGSVMSGVRATLGLFKFALTEALRPLQSFVRFLRDNFERGRQAYVSALRSGGGTGYSAQRSALANLLGVGEDEVYQFGRAVEYMNSKVKFSSEVTAAASRTLAEASLEWRAIQADVRAAGMAVANEFAPVFRDMVAELRGYIPTLTAFASGVAGAVSAQVRGFKLLNDILSKGLVAGLAQGFADLNKPRLPEAPTSLERFQSSPWERMGLVLGGAGAANYSQQTARNTARMAALLEKMAGSNSANLDAVRQRAHPHTNRP